MAARIINTQGNVDWAWFLKIEREGRTGMGSWSGFNTWRRTRDESDESGDSDEQLSLSHAPPPPTQTTPYLPYPCPARRADR